MGAECTSYAKHFCQKIGFGRILDLPRKPNLLMLFLIIMYWNPKTSRLVHTPWDCAP